MRRMEFDLVPGGGSVGIYNDMVCDFVSHGMHTLLDDDLVRRIRMGMGMGDD